MLRHRATLANSWVNSLGGKIVGCGGPLWIVEATGAVFRVPGGLLNRFALELENTGSNPQREATYRLFTSDCAHRSPGDRISVPGS